MPLTGVKPMEEVVFVMVNLLLQIAHVAAVKVISFVRRASEIGGGTFRVGSEVRGERFKRACAAAFRRLIVGGDTGAGIFAALENVKRGSRDDIIPLYCNGASQKHGVVDYGAASVGVAACGGIRTHTDVVAANADLGSRGIVLNVVLRPKVARHRQPCIARAGLGYKAVAVKVTARAIAIQIGHNARSASVFRIGCVDARHKAVL